MPNITIKESDLTNPGSLNVTSNVVYVPGLATKVPKNFNTLEPRLYSDLAIFQADFGDKVPIVKKDATDSDPKTFDTGYIYAVELLRLGMPVLFDCLVNKSVVVGVTDTGRIDISGVTGKKLTLSQIAGAATNALSNEALKDKGLYNIKFVTNGGYVDANTNEKVRELASNRMDCCAILDILKGTTIKDITTALTDTTKLEDIGLPDPSIDASKYSAAFAPWGTYAPPCVSNYPTGLQDSSGKAEYYPSIVKLPASFGYLLAAANSFKAGAANWSAIAGATRGNIPYLISLDEYYTESQINNILQTNKGISINPIARINPFGDIIWGNRTLHDNTIKGGLTASSFLNIRNLISDIKKTVFTAARQLTFEQNSIILWVKFQSLIKPTLDRMVNGSGISGYELIRKVSKEKAKLTATIRIYAIEAVEDFDITIELADDAAITE